MFLYEKHIDETKNIYMTAITYRMYMFISTYIKEHISAIKTMYMLKITCKLYMFLYKKHIDMIKKHIYDKNNI